MSIPSILRHPVVMVAAVFVALTILGPMAGLPFDRVTQVAIYTLYAVGVGILVSYTGLVPFGASVFFGCAGYAAALTAQIVPNEFAGLAAALILSIVLALGLGVLVLRRSGVYFSLLTLASSQIAFEIAYRWNSVTGGENGLQNVPRPLFESSVSFHVFASIVVCAVVWCVWQMVHAPFGRSLQAIRDNEQRALSIGIDAARHRLVAFTISGAVIGLAGALNAFMLRGAYANSLRWEHAGDALLMSVLGGVHHFLGALWGAIAFILLQDTLSTVTENWWLLFAPIIIISVLFFPEGLHGLVARGKRWTLIHDQLPARPASPPAIASREAGEPGKVVLSVSSLSKRFGSLVVADKLSVDIAAHTLHSFIGPNGAGKTTFFNMLSGALPADSGTISFNGQDISHLPQHLRARLGISRSFQIVSIFNNLTAFENVRVVVQQTRRQSGYWRDALSDDAVNAQTWATLDAFDLTDYAQVIGADLSHGRRRLLDIAMSVATNAELLLLDEPLAGLTEADRQTVARIIRNLVHRHTVVLIEHDIDRVVAISDRITVLHQGHIIADGAPAEVVAHPEVIKAYLGDRQDSHGTAAPRRASLDGAPNVLELRDVKSGYGDAIVVNGVSLEVKKGEVLALLGRNGVGKTSLLRTIMGVLPVSAGTITLNGAQISGLPAHRISRRGVAMVPEGRRLFPNLTVEENLSIAARNGGADIEEAYNLFPKLRTIQTRRADLLSGGERQMVAVARAMMAPTDIILLDEPFEGLAPAIVHEVMQGVLRLRENKALILVEHHADAVLSISDRACIMVNGRVAYFGDARELAADSALQAKLLGVAAKEMEPSA